MDHKPTLSIDVSTIFVIRDITVSMLTITFLVFISGARGLFLGISLGYLPQWEWVQRMLCDWWLISWDPKPLYTTHYLAWPNIFGELVHGAKYISILPMGIKFFQKILTMHRVFFPVKLAMGLCMDFFCTQSKFNKRLSR